MLDSSIEPPEKIEFDKVVAVLKAIIGSTRDDKIQLEVFYGESSAEDKSVGLMIESRLKNLGLGYQDLYTFVYEKGFARRRGGRSLLGGGGR